MGLLGTCITWIKQALFTEDIVTLFDLAKVEIATLCGRGCITGSLGYDGSRCLLVVLSALHHVLDGLLESAALAFLFHLMILSWC